MHERLFVYFTIKLPEKLLPLRCDVRRSLSELNTIDWPFRQRRKIKVKRAVKENESPRRLINW